jgi:hypothetical protein
MIISLLKHSIHFILNKLFLFNFLIYFCIFSSATASLDITNPNQILEHSQSIRRVPSIQADALLKTKSAQFNDEKEFIFYRKLSEDKERFKTLTRFKKPLTINNQAILFLEKENFENSIFMYLPSFKKVRRVESHSQSSSFMGSAFSYSDIATPLSKDFNNILTKTDTCPIDKKSKCFLIESKPKNNEIKERTNYSLQQSWINSLTFLPEQTLLFSDNSKSAIKKVTFSDYYKIKNDLWFCKNLIIEDIKSNKTTSLIFNSLKFDQEISNSLFTQQALGDEK